MRTPEYSSEVMTMQHANASSPISERRADRTPVSVPVLHGTPIVYVVQPGDNLYQISLRTGVSLVTLINLNGISDPRKLRAGQTLKILNGPFHAIVYKGQFTLELWLGEPNAKGSMYITSYPVGLGRDDSTPTGVWAIQNKLKNPAYYSPRGEGIIQADDRKLRSSMSKRGA